jgi:hypothetical protein
VRATGIIEDLIFNLENLIDIYLHAVLRKGKRNDIGWIKQRNEKGLRNNMIIHD